MNISNEQKIIYEHIKDGKNVIVDSIAGSGKSTTIINIAQLMPEKRFLHITYNSMLRKEFKQKVISLNLTNIEVHTYHSLAVKYFHPTAFTDTGIREILAMKILPVIPLPKFDIVVMDECQDMTRLYYKFTRLVVSLISKEKTSINKISSFPFPFEIVEEDDNDTTPLDTDDDNGGGEIVDISPHPPSLPPQLLFLGDYKQCLYEFKGADWRFLTLADKIWNIHPPESFVHCSLKTSYRITNQMSSFVNNVMLGEPRMNACREGSPVIYIRNIRHHLENIIIHHIKKILNEGDLPSDIFVLAPSVKNKYSSVRKLENALVECGIPCHVPMFENERITDEKVINGKIVFSTFHSVKGRQRKYVFVMNFDNSYFSFNARTLDPTVCPNTLYVATTRATHQLYLLEVNNEPTDRSLEFLKMSHSQMNQTDYIDFKGRPQTAFYEKVNQGVKEDKIPSHRATPTDIIKFLPESVLEKIVPLLKKIIKPVSPSTTFPEEIDVPSVVYLKNGLYEDVSDLNGVAIPAIYCDFIQRKTNAPATTPSSKEETNTTPSTKEVIPSFKEKTTINEDTPNILWRYINHEVTQINEKDHQYLKRIFQTLSPFCKTPAEYLYMSNVYIAFQERLYFKLKQIDIDEYNWLTEEMMNKCNQRIDTIICHTPGNRTTATDPTTDPITDPITDPTNDPPSRQLGNNFVFENTFIHYSQEDKHTMIDQLLRPYLTTQEVYRFTARLDLITEQDVWELKFVKEITTEHYLQFVIYAWLWRCVHYNDEVQYVKEFKLFNIRKEEVFELTASLEELTEIVALIVKSKYEVVTTQTEDEFLDSCGE